MKTIDFYYAAQKSNSFTDAQMARALEITTAAIANAKKREHLSAYNAVKCAEMAGLDIAAAITAAAIEAEHEPSKRKYLADKLKAALPTINIKKLATIAPVADVAQSVEQLIRNQ